MGDDIDVGEGRFNIGRLIKANPIPSALLLIGLMLFGTAAFFLRGNIFTSSNVEVLEADTGDPSTLVIEISGAVTTPGVYELENGKRIADAIEIAGGITEEADLVWIEKTLNRAAKVKDGQKIYIPEKVDPDKQSEVTSARDLDGDQTISSPNSSETEGKVNINSATQLELEKLWGIGPVTGKNIVEQRPYSNVEELLEKDILKKNVYDRNKDLMTVY